MENNSQKKTKKESNFVIQGTILAVAGIFCRLIGLAYRVPMINIIGDDGIGYYQTAFNVYSIMLLLSSYSLPLAVSKMISARIAKGEYINAGRILKASLFYATLVGGIGCSVTWFGAEFFANSVFRMPFCVYALRTLAPTIWIMAYLGVFRGYFQGLGTMVPTATSQIFEQIINALVSVGAAAVLFGYGVKANLIYEATEYPNAYGAAGGTIGTGAGALTALLFLLFLFYTHRKTRKRQIRKDATGSFESYGEITGVLCMTVIPVILSTSVYNLSGIIDNGLFGQCMVKLGRAAETATLYGIYSGKYQLLINVPVAIANSLSSSLIPALSRAVASKNRGQTLDRVATSIRFSMIVAIPSTVGLTVLAGPINMLLFSSSNEIAIKMTMIGSISVAFYSLSTVSNAILQGLSHMNVPIRNAIISLVLHVGVFWVLMMGLDWGVYSIVFANVFFSFMMCLLNGLAIRRILNYNQEIKKTFLLPTICAAVMGAATYGAHLALFKLGAGNAISTAVSCLVAVAVYAVLLIKTGCVDEVELYSMPKGAKLVKLAHKLRLL